VLQWLLNAAIVLAAVGLGIRIHAASSPSPQLGYPLAGDELELLRLVRTADATHIPAPSPSCTAIVFVRSTCPACERVAPSYTDKRSVRFKDASVADLVWVGFAGDEGYDEFVARHRLWQPVRLRSSDANSWGVDKVPLMYIVDREGKLVVVTHPAPAYVDSLEPSGCLVNQRGHAGMPPTYKPSGEKYKTPSENITNHPLTLFLPARSRLRAAPRK
jgi:hypothetical protein